MPSVSVVIPTYNRVRRIRHAVESVVTQTYADLEVLVVDDGSEDDTAQVVKECGRKDPRIRLIEHGRTRGAQAARNTGIRAARGEWIAFLDSDDQWLPYSLEARLETARREKVKVVHSECYVIGEDGSKKLFRVPAMAGWIYRSVLTAPGPLFQALLVVKDVLERIGYLDERIVSFQEWDTAIRLAGYCPFAFVSEPTFIYDCRGTDTISKDKMRDAVGYEQVFRKHALTILRCAGPRVLARHYRTAASRYEAAGDCRAERRCLMMSALWWPFRRSIVRRFRRLLPL